MLDAGDAKNTSQTPALQTIQASTVLKGLQQNGNMGVRYVAQVGL